MRILIVDDEQQICDLATYFLNSYGDCLTAQSGEDAIEILQDTWARGETIDCIFLDLMMPDMNGIETLREIRRLERERSQSGVDEIKIIILTASNNPKDVVGSFKEQGDGYIVKPFDEEKLAEELKNVGLI